MLINQLTHRSAISTTFILRTSLTSHPSYESKTQKKFALNDDVEFESRRRLNKFARARRLARAPDLLSKSLIMQETENKYNARAFYEHARIL